MSKLVGVFCTFGWQKGARWKLIDVVEQLDDGWVGSERVDEFCSHLAQERSGSEWVPIPGRLVYYWSWSTGPTMLKVNPPNSWPKWLSRMCWDLVMEKDRRQCEVLIEGHFEAKNRTVEEARKRVLNGTQHDCAGVDRGVADDGPERPSIATR